VTASLGHGYIACEGCLFANNLTEKFPLELYSYFVLFNSHASLVDNSHEITHLTVLLCTIKDNDVTNPSVSRYRPIEL
jgi:hypothetical protein